MLGDRGSTVNVWSFFHRQESRGGHNVVQSDTIPSTQLATELLIIIFEHLLPISSYTEAFLFRINPALVFFQWPLLQAPPYYADLLSCLTVSRAWHDVAVTALYSRPLLMSNRHVIKFCDGLQKNPELGALVKHLFLLNDHREYQPESFMELWAAEFSRSRARAALIATLRLCTSLVSLTLTGRNRYGASVLPIDPAFVKSSNIGQHMRKLTIYGSPLPVQWGRDFFLLPQTKLPALEALCLREVCIHSDFTLPLLPNLHTLQLVQCYHDVSSTQASPSRKPKELHISLEQLPELRVLHLFSNPSVPISISAQVMCKLTEMSIIDVDFREGSYTSPTWDTQSQPTALRRLLTSSTQGLQESLQSSSSWPPNIEELTLVWATKAVEKNVSGCLDLFDAIIEDLDSRSATSRLRMIKIYRQFSAFYSVEQEWGRTFKREHPGVEVLSEDSKHRPQLRRIPSSYIDISPHEDVYNTTDLITGLAKFRAACAERDVTLLEYSYSE